MGAAQSERTLAVDNADWMSDVTPGGRAGGARVHFFTLSPALVQRLRTEAMQKQQLAEDGTTGSTSSSQEPPQQLTQNTQSSQGTHPLNPDGHSPSAARNTDLPNSFVMVLPSRDKSNSSSPRQVPSPQASSTSSHFINPELSQRLPNLVRGDGDKEEGLYFRPPSERQLRDQMQAHVREVGAVRARVQSPRSALLVRLSDTRAALEKCYSDNPQDALVCSPYVRAFKDITDSNRLDQLRLPAREEGPVTGGSG